MKSKKLIAMSMVAAMACTTFAGTASAEEAKK